MTTWFLVADAGRSRILETSASDPSLREINARIHAGSRLHTSELMTDGAGRTMRGLGREAHSAMEPRTSPHDTQAKTFAHGLARHLQESFYRGSFDELVLVAPPRFLGLLRQTLAHQVLEAVKSTITKDYTQSTLNEVRDGLVVNGVYRVPQRATS